MFKKKSKLLIAMIVTILIGSLSSSTAIIFKESADWGRTKIKESHKVEFLGTGKEKIELTKDKFSDKVILKYKNINEETIDIGLAISIDNKDEYSTFDEIKLKRGSSTTLISTVQSYGKAQYTATNVKPNEIVTVEIHASRKPRPDKLSQGAVNQNLTIEYVAKMGDAISGEVESHKVNLVGPKLNTHVPGGLTLERHMIDELTPREVHYEIRTKNGIYHNNPDNVNQYGTTDKNNHEQIKDKNNKVIGTKHRSSYVRKDFERFFGIKIDETFSTYDKEFTHYYLDLKNQKFIPFDGDTLEVPVTDETMYDMHKLRVVAVKDFRAKLNVDYLPNGADKGNVKIVDKNTGDIIEERTVSKGDVIDFKIPQYKFNVPKNEKEWDNYSYIGEKVDPELVFDGDDGTDILFGHDERQNRYGTIYTAYKDDSIFTYEKYNSNAITGFRDDYKERAKALYGDSGVTDIVIPKVRYSPGHGYVQAARSISSNAFEGNQELRKITFEEGASYNIKSEAFKDSSVEVVNIEPNSVSAIRSGAFGGTNLTELIGNEGIHSVEGSVIRNTKVKHVDMSKANATYSQNSFQAAELESFKLHPEIDKIYNYMFAENKLKNVDLSEYKSIKEIRDSAFAYNNLESLKLSESVEIIESGAFTKNDLKAVDLEHSNNLTSVERNAFSRNHDIQLVILPRNFDPTVFEERAFGDLSVKSGTLVVADKSKTIISEEGNLLGFEGVDHKFGLNDEKNTYVMGHDEYNSISFKNGYIKSIDDIPESANVLVLPPYHQNDAGEFVPTLGFEKNSINSPFEDFSNMKVLVGLGRNYQNELSGSYVNLKSLELIDFSRYSNMKEIEDEAFTNIFNLKEIRLPDSIEVIGKYAFQRTRIFAGNSTLKLPDNLIEIKERAFDDAAGGEVSRATLEIGPNLKIIGNSAFNSVIVNTIVIHPDAMASADSPFKFSAYQTDEGNTVYGSKKAGDTEDTLSGFKITFVDSSEHWTIRPYHEYVRK